MKNTQTATPVKPVKPVYMIYGGKPYAPCGACDICNDPINAYSDCGQPVEVKLESDE